MRITQLPFVLATVALFAGCSSSEVAVEDEPTPVRVEAATVGPAMPAIATNGVVANKDEMRLSFKVTGVIQRIAVEEGQAVKAGQQLAGIELAEIDAQVEQARQAAARADRDLARGEKLVADRLISQQQLQDLRTQAEVARSQLQSAEFNRGHAVIIAPGDGVVLRKLAQERELLAAGQPVLVVGLRSRGYVVRCALADREAVRVRLGDPATVSMDAFPGGTFAAAVTEIAGAADERTGLFPVEIRLDDPPRRLLGGLVARVELYPESTRNAARTYVPIGAVLEGDGDTAAVFVLDGTRVKRREIRVAFFAPRAVALQAGLQPGEQVVTEGALYLQDGETVTVLAPRE
jgi:RND family efflux transporter MFP subunit